MRALTLHQPWASLVALGHKQIETRSWPTRHRGPLAIHAAKTQLPTRTFEAQSLGQVMTQQQWDEMPFGAVVAVAELHEMFYIDRTVHSAAPELVALNATGFPTDHKPVPAEQVPYGDYSPGRWAWMFKDVFPVDPPLPARGMQGLWTWHPTQ